MATKQVDLTTLSGFDSLSAGTHAITVMAKADGYVNSDLSAAVLVTKEAEVTNFKLGVNDIDAIYIGSEEVTEAYLGKDQIYKKDTSAKTFVHIPDTLSSRAKRMILRTETKEQIVEADDLPGKRIQLNDDVVSSLPSTVVAWFDENDGTFVTDDLEEVTYATNAVLLADHYAACWSTGSTSVSSIVIDSIQDVLHKTTLTFDDIPTGTSNIGLQTSGFYPNVYNAKTKKPVDSTTYASTLIASKASYNASTMFGASSYSLTIRADFYDERGDKLLASPQTAMTVNDATIDLSPTPLSVIVELDYAGMNKVDGGSSKSDVVPTTHYPTRLLYQQFDSDFNVAGAMKRATLTDGRTTIKWSDLPNVSTITSNRKVRFFADNNAYTVNALNDILVYPDGNPSNTQFFVYDMKSIGNGAIRLARQTATFIVGNLSDDSRASKMKLSINSALGFNLKTLQISGPATNELVINSSNETVQLDVFANTTISKVDVSVSTYNANDDVLNEFARPAVPVRPDFYTALQGLGPVMKTIVANSYALDWPISLANVSSSIAFTSNNQQFTAMTFNASTLTLTYANNVTNATVVAFTDADGWTNEAYSFVTVTTDAKVMNDFYDFFTTSAARGKIFISSSSMDPYRALAFTYKSESSAILATQTEINENGLTGQFELSSELIDTLPACVGLWMDENQDYLSVTNLRQITLTDASLFSLTKPLTPEVLIYNSSTSVPAINKELTEEDDVYPLLFAKVRVKGVPANTATIKATKQSAYPKQYNAVTNTASTSYADCTIEGPYDKDKSFSVYMRCFVTKNSTASIGNVRFTCLDSSGAAIESKVVAINNISDFTTVVTCDFSASSDEPTDEDAII